MLGRIRGWQRRHWRERSKAERVELQSVVTWHVTTWALYFAWLVFPMAGDLGRSGMARVLGGALMVVGALQCVAANVLTRPALDHYLGRRTVGGRLLTVPWLLLGLALGIVVGLRATGAADPITCRMALGSVLMAFGLVYAMVVPRGAFLLRGAVLAVVCMAGFAASGGGAVDVVLAGGLVAFASAFSLFAARCGAWTLAVLWEAERAREIEARLAVAEERLRFGRDLHDVMGRNLAVIALKSELAVQLARRGRVEAVEQMIEVQRIAQESQREVREVVRGYREADLGVELAGAQGVLTAAGISCEVAGEVGGLPAGVQSALGWVVREATTNVLRHGDAGWCSVAVEVAEGRVVLAVENDGAGAVAGVGGGGSGLAGLRERLAEVGGTLTAGPVGGGVFRLVAEVPLASSAVAAAEGAVA
ncbi:histidine kinase [Streptomyces sp. Ru71]|uniref:sensor histidine kinase n=1 Tax=Streptomyces sp. Ru71 TaxID=2080746 RepID=UPI000CDD3F8C|nr:histidine kinase [Streptomyces sp. Ru71]POX50038.1 histidine kinase [Streptomyces sp. Ru71]